MMIIVTIPGIPIPLKRPRFSRRRVYDSQVKLKETIFHMIQDQVQGLPASGPVTVVITFFMRIPKSLSKTKKKFLLGKPHCKRPDVDNLIKFYLDVCNGLLYDDDSQIHKIVASKVYSDEPSTKIELIFGDQNEV